MTTIRKDQTGYDLKQLFVGSEGTLGIITEAAILCGPLPLKRVTALVSVDTFEEVLLLVQKAKITLGNILSILEFMDKETVDLTTGGTRNCDLFSEEPYSFCVILEIEVYSQHDTNSSQLKKFLDNPPVKIINHKFCSSENEASNIWRIRDDIV